MTVGRSRRGVSRTATNLRVPDGDSPRVAASRQPYHPRVIPVGPDLPGSPTATLRLRRLPERIAGARPIDAAEAFRDLPGLALLESARPGRNARWTYMMADPVAVLESPAAGPDPFAVARRLLARLDATTVVPADAPRFLGGLVGFLGYDLGHILERLPSVAEDDQGLPPLRLALHDWVVAWDRRTGHAWLGGRALDGDGRRLARRLDEVHARLTTPGPGASLAGAIAAGPRPPRPRPTSRTILATPSASDRRCRERPTNRGSGGSGRTSRAATSTRRT